MGQFRVAHEKYVGDKVKGALLAALGKAPQKGAGTDDDDVAAAASSSADKELVAALGSKDAKRIRRAIRLICSMDEDVDD